MSATRNRLALATHTRSCYFRNWTCACIMPLWRCNSQFGCLLDNVPNTTRTHHAHARHPARHCAYTLLAFSPPRAPPASPPYRPSPTLPSRPPPWFLVVLFSLVVHLVTVDFQLPPSRLMLLKAPAAIALPLPCPPPRSASSPGPSPAGFFARPRADLNRDRWIQNPEC